MKPWILVLNMCSIIFNITIMMYNVNKGRYEFIALNSLGILMGLVSTYLFFYVRGKRK